MASLWIGLITLFVSSTALAYTPKEGSVTATLGPFMSKTNFDDSRIHENHYLTGVGFIANGDINNNGALEIGIFSMRKEYIRELGGLLYTEEIELVHVTMGYRRWFTPLFSGSLTFASAYTMGTPAVAFNQFAPGAEPNTSATDNTEYGFDFALQYEIWSDKRISLVADTRYSWMVTNKLHEHGDHYGLFVGLRYLIQEKYPDLTKEDKKAPPPAKSKDKLQRKEP